MELGVLMEKETMDKPKELQEIVNEKLNDAQTPGANVEFDPDEADLAGAFEEDSISEQDALESNIDQVSDSNK
jgi:hypothetical protein